MGIFCIFLANDFGRVREVIVVVAGEGIAVEGDNKEDNNGEVVVEEESCTMIGAIGEVKQGGKRCPR